jgi:NADH dehydrogenase
MILVTGATGYLGRYVIKALVDSGQQVRCLVRNAKMVNFPGTEVVQGDITDPVSLAVACTGIDTIVHLVAIIREKKNINFTDINITGTQNLLNVAKTSNVKHFIHVSALGANTNPKYKYTYSKGIAEVSVLNSGINYTILRPSVIFGPGFGFVDRLLQALRMTPTFVAVPGNGATKFQPISVKDVAKCIEIVAQQPERYANKTIDVGGPEHLTYEQMLDILMEVTNIKKTKLHVPMPLVRVATNLMQRFMTDPPVTLVELTQLDLDNTCNTNSIKMNFGFTPTKFADGLEYIQYKLKEQKEDSI